MGIFILTTVGSEAAFDWLDDEDLEKGWVRAHTRHTKHGDIQIKAHYDRRTKKMEVPTPRRKARVKEQPPEKTHPERERMIGHAKEIATAIKKIQSGTHDFKLSDHTPEQAVGNLKNQLKHLVSKLQQHKIDYHGGFTGEELKSGMHKKSGKIAEVNGKELHANFDAKGNHKEFTPADHAEAAKVHQELSQKAVELHRGADAGGDSEQAKQHLEAAMHHGTQETMHKIEAIEKKQTEKAEAKKAFKAKAEKQTTLTDAQVRYLGKFEENNPLGGQMGGGNATHQALAKRGMLERREDNRWYVTAAGRAALGGGVAPEAKAPEEKPTKAEKQPKLSITQAAYLNEVGKHPGENMQGRVKTQAALEKMGLIERGPHAISKRHEGWHLTDAGKAIFESKMKGYQAVHQKAIFEREQKNKNTNFSRHASKFMSYDASDPWQVDQIEHLNKVPEHVFDSIMKDHTVYLGKGGILDLNDMKNVLKTGEYGEKTSDDPRKGWEDVGGGYYWPDKKVLVGTDAKYHEVVALHEFGHAVGWRHTVNGTIAQMHPEFKKIYENIHSGLSPYFSKANPGGAREVFAECFALSIHNEKTARKTFGDEAVNWMKDKVLTDPNSLAGADVRRRELAARQQVQGDPKARIAAAEAKIAQAGATAAPSTQGALFPGAGGVAASAAGSASSATPASPTAGTPPIMDELLQHYRDELPNRGGLTSVKIPDIWKRYSDAAKARGELPNKEKFDQALLDSFNRGESELTPHERPTALSEQEKNDSIVTNKTANDVLHFWRPMSAVNEAAKRRAKTGSTTIPPQGAKTGSPAAQTEPSPSKTPTRDEIEKRVLQEHAAHPGKDEDGKMRLHDLRQKMPDVPRDKLDRVLQHMDSMGKINLYGEHKNPKEGDKEAAVEHEGSQRHTFGPGGPGWTSKLKGADSEGPEMETEPEPAKAAEKPAAPTEKAGLTGQGAAMEASKKKIQDRILNHYAEAHAKNPHEAMRLHDLRQKMPDVSKFDLDRALSDLHVHSKIGLTSISRDKRQEGDQAAALDHLGLPRHAFKADTDESKPAEKPPLPKPKVEPKATPAPAKSANAAPASSLEGVKDRIRKEYKEHTGVEEGQMMRLHDLRQRMSDVPREKLDRALKVMHANGEGMLTHKGKASYTTEKSKEDIHAALHHEGENNHKFMIGTKETKPGLKATKKEKPTKREKEK